MKRNNLPILITGAARSRTSMVAGIVHMSGAWGGEMSGPNPNNPKGMFENTAIRNELVKPYLHSLGADPMGQRPLPRIEDIAIYDKLIEDGTSLWENKVFSVLKDQGLAEETEWFYKGAKMCLVWPLWHAAFPKARWIIVRRKTDGIIDSCLKTSFMRAYSGRRGWAEWVSSHEALFDQMIRGGLDVREIWTDKIVEGNYSEIEFTINDLGLKWDGSKVDDFVIPKQSGGNTNGQ